MKRSATNSEVGASPEKVEKVVAERGTSGTPVQLIANYFKLEKSPTFVLSQYRVDFAPEIDVTATRKRLVNENRIHIAKRFIFDGTSLYVSQKLPEKVEINTIYNNNPMKVIIYWTGSVESTDQAAFQLLNLIFREAMGGLNLQNVRKDLYDPEAKIAVPAGNLELWPGYVTSIRAHDNDILLCTEISHKFMRKETILDIAQVLIRTSNSNWQELLKQEVIGTVVLTDYTNRTYQIDDVDFTLSPRSTFQPRNSETAMSYYEYYQKTYAITIKDKQQFMLVSNPKASDLRAGRTDPIYLIPELCRATGMTDKMRANFQLMKDISSYTRLDPNARCKALKKFNDRMQTTEKSINVLQEWDMELDKELLKLEGRQLPREVIMFGGEQQEPVSDKGEWSFKGRTAMYKPVKIVRWMCVYPESLQAEVESFLGVLKNACDIMNLEIADPIKLPLKDDSQKTYLDVVRDQAKRNPNLFLIILPTNRADRYSAVKSACIVELGISSQVVIKRILTHKNVLSVASKIAVQMSTKLGGIPWLVKVPVPGLMTVAFDVSIHPKDRSRSIGAIVATMELKSGIFFSTTSPFRDGNEMNIQLAEHMRKALEIFKEKCGALPQKIVFYRDGVSEGQFAFIMEQEVQPLIKKLKSIYGEDEAKLAYIIVNKRINTRIMKQVGARIVNPEHGTVVDQQITLPGRNDFFLVSQHVGQGTVAPTYYNIVHNTTGLNKDKLEMLTFKMTHLYYNWGGTTRIPMVCQYAKKLAFMTSQSLQGQKCHQNLQQALYFI